MSLKHLSDARLIFTISEDGVSSKTMDRPGFQKVLRMLRNDEADGIWVSRLDRMTRQVRHLIALAEDLFVAKSKHLMSVAEQTDTNTPMGRACLTILSAVAQLERENIDLARELRANHWSYHKIAEKLTRRGIPTKTGNERWIHTSVRRMLPRSDGWRGSHDRSD